MNKTQGFLLVCLWCNRDTNLKLCSSCSLGPGLGEKRTSSRPEEASEKEIETKSGNTQESVVRFDSLKGLFLTP